MKGYIESDREAFKATLEVTLKQEALLVKQSELLDKQLRVTQKLIHRLRATLAQMPEPEPSPYHKPSGMPFARQALVEQGIIEE